ncbi:MAG: molybdopterin-dependent oxidoreductase [Azospirillum sp.]|nr:molybdopterin-dependent oxidoreductase [Azospirillum sp.]
MDGSREIPPTPTRRAFLQSSAAGFAGLVLGFTWTGKGRLGVNAAQAAADGRFAPNAFVRIAGDNTVTVVIKHLEMGQGIDTGLATILAEELDADWAQIRSETAPADAAVYNNLNWGPVQGTGGSSSIANSYPQLRQAGAAARALLVSAAAETWGVEPATITVKQGVIAHAASGRSARFGELAAKAATLPIPAELPLKEPRSFTLIGTRLPRLDSAAKTDGTARFALDIMPPGTLVALIRRPDRFHATLKSVEAGAARAIAGVVDVVTVPAGVAVLAKGFWAAKQGRDALAVEWDEAAAEKRGSAELLTAYQALAATPGLPARREGDVAAALAGAAKRITASYQFPYLAHAPMEPLNCVVVLTPDGCDIWAGDQFQTMDQANAAATAGLKPEQVRIHTVYAGGSFGRRANAASDYIVEAVSIAKAVGANGTPIKLIWTREDDIKGGRYRPMYYHTLEGGLDGDGNPVAWRHRIIGQSIIAGTPFAKGFIKEGIDHTSVEGAANLPYAIPNLAVELHTTEVGVPVLWWRSVGGTHNAYATEAFLDELGEAGGQDPLALRRRLLAGHSRHQGVLDLAAAKSDWGSALSAGRGRGIAVHEDFHTFVAQVAEVTVAPSGKVRVDRIVCAVDCGRAINPDVIKAQIEGGIGYGLAALLYGRVTLAEGRVEQSNFHDYQVLRIDEMPKIEVHIVPSDAAPTGVGELGVPALGPAVANAVYAASGKRIRVLPFEETGNA